MLAVKGTIQGNTVVIKDEDIKKYDGKDVIVTILDFQFEQQKKQVDLKKYMGRGEKLFQSDAQEAIIEGTCAGYIDRDRGISAGDKEKYVIFF